MSNGKLFTIVIAWFTLAFGALCLFWGYQALSYHAKTIIFADTGYLIRQLIDEPEPEKKALFLLGFGAYIMGVSLFGIYRNRRYYQRLLGQ